MSDFPSPRLPEATSRSPGVWQRFKARPRWLRCAAFTGALVVLLGGISALTDRSGDHDSVAPVTVPRVPGTPAPTERSTVTSTEPPSIEQTMTVAEETMTTTAQELTTTLAPTATVVATENPTTVPGSP